MKLATLNVKGCRDFVKLGRVIAYLRENRVDLALLCESHLDEGILTRVQQRWRNCGWFSNSPNSASCGVTFINLSPERIPLDTCEVYHRGLDGRSIGLRCKIEGSSSSTFLGVYAPNVETENVAFFHTLSGDPSIGAPTFILGDFNKVMDPLDRNPTRGEDRRTRNAIDSLTGQKGFVDGWRETYPKDRSFTYWGDNELSSASRIDRIYAKPTAFRKCLKWHILQAPGWTDHAMPVVEFCPRDKVDMGRGLWSLNVNLLKNPKIKRRMIRAINKHLTAMQAVPFPTADLEMEIMTPNAAARLIMRHFKALMARIRKIGVKTQKSLAAAHNKLENKLSARLNRLDKRERTRKRGLKVRHLRSRLSALEKARSARKVQRSLAKWLDMGESSAEFWALGRAPMVDRSLQGLADDAGRVRKKSKKVVEIARKFYETLYTAEPTSLQASRKLCEMLPRGDFSGVTGEVTRAEVTKVIRKWKYGKVPGPSGISYDFFKEFRREGPEGCDLTEALRRVMSILIQPDVYGVKVPRKWKDGIIKVVYKN